MADADVPYRRLDTYSQTWLLERCREAIARHLAHNPPQREPADVPPLCQQRLACFVTLHTLDATLRGCVGALDAHEPLWRLAEQMSIAAACRDPRFPAMKTAELEGTVIEIAALSPHRAIAPEAVEVGRHGIWIEHGVHRGVLLPQAATTYHWTRESFIDAACERAGLAKDAWRHGGVSVRVFTADVFTESARLQ